MEIQQLAISSLAPAPYNPRRCSDWEMRKLMRNIEKFGLVENIVVNKDMTIISGHQRVEACKNLGLETIPAYVVDLPKDQEQALNLAMNRISGEFDEAKLADLLKDFTDEQKMLSGFDESEIAKALKTATEGEEDDFTPKEPQGEATSKLGEVYALGKHRLMCGDATSKADMVILMDGKMADMVILMDGKMADMVWTDPPYGVSYVGKTKDALEIDNDDLKPAELESFLSAAFTLANEYIQSGGAWYVAAPPGPLFTAFAHPLAALGIWRQTLVWVKSVFVMGRSDYHYRHEAIFYGWKPGGTHYFVDDRTQDTVWEFDKPSRNAEHPTMKPIPLIVRAINNSSLKDQVVLDTFGGSGSTLIASEQTGRQCFMMELDPHYVDVIVQRWEQYTGQKAVKIV